MKRNELKEQRTLCNVFLIVLEVFTFRLTLEHVKTVLTWSDTKTERSELNFGIPGGSVLGKRMFSKAGQVAMALGGVPGASF